LAKSSKISPLRSPAAARAEVVSVVVPVYNEAQNLAGLWARLGPVLARLGRPWEAVFVDDGSADESLEILRGIASAEDGRVRVVELARNFGQHAAILAGFRECRGDIVVTLDADLQNPPEEIPRLIEAVDAGNDVVGGWRMRRQDGALRRAASQLHNRLTSLMVGVPMHDYGCMLRAYRRSIIERVNLCSERSTYVTALVCWVGGRFAEVEVTHAPRRNGKSKYSYFKLFELYFNLLTGFSILPLQLISFLGMACSVFGFGLGMKLVLARILFGNDPGGFRSVFAVIFFLFGLVIFSLGLIGEYIGRIYIEVQGRPGFLIRERVELRSVERGKGRAELPAAGPEPHIPPVVWSSELESQLQVEPK
jgi:undecaprenyl-phosphate 4-deoxy-4-formamido-L-arabinose transferase